MKAGFSECDITPTIGMEQPGDYLKAYIKKIHDVLKVRASVFDDGKQRVALVGLDTIGIPDRIVSEIRKNTEKKCGIKSGHILLAAAHDHCAGPLFGFMPERFDRASSLIKGLAINNSITIDCSYYDLMLNQVVSAICEADKNKEEVLCSVGSGYEDKACYNRRFKMKNGRTVTHPGQCNPDIVGPAGPIDPEVGVVAAWDKQGKLLGCIVNFACHATTNPFNEVSADWIYFLEKTICGVYGDDAVVVFLNGACGDVTQVNNQVLDTPQWGEGISRVVGQRVGAEVLKVLAAAYPGNIAPVHAANRLLCLKRRKPSPAHIKKSMEILEKYPKNSADWIFAKEVVVLDYLMKDEPEVNAEVQAIQIGPAIFISNPAEYFCQFGLNIKKKSPFPFTYIVELANGCIGYVPTKEAFNKAGGGYETVLTSYSNVEVTAGDKIEKASIELARGLKPGKVPERLKTKPSKKIWTYGILGPDLE